MATGDDIVAAGDHAREASTRPRGLEDDGGAPSVDDLRRQQQREIEHIGVGTEGQTKGASVGAVVGALIGALVLFAVACVISDSAAVRVVLPVMGALFFSVAGGVYGGGRRPELTNETVDLEGRPETQPADDLAPKGGE
jgi:hypothetical protein